MRIHGTANKSLGSMSPLALILTEQPELKDRMKLLSLRAIGQHINVRFHLSGPSEEETKDYVFHSLRKADGTHILFSEDAIKAVYLHSKGIPRIINSICSDCLVDAMTRE